MAGLASLIRLRRFELDAERRALADLEERKTEAEAKAVRLAETLRAEQEAAAKAEDPRTAASYPDFARKTREQQLRLAAQITRLEAAILSRRDALTDSFRALKTLEEAEAARRREAKAKAAAAEAQAMDEIAIEGFRRRQGDGA